MTTRSYHDEPVNRTGVGTVRIRTRDSRRAARFYDRVLGFRLVSESRTRGAPCILMRGPGCAYLVIDEHRDVVRVPRRLRFEAVDLDYARERLWNLGVALADGCVEPRFDPERRCRWLPVRDPDGNEIELVEQVSRSRDWCAVPVPELADEELAALEI